VPVKIFQSPPPSAHKYVKKEKPSPKEEAFTGDIGDRGLETYTARLKKLPTSLRTPKKGEKLYPIDLNLKNADLVEAVRVLAETMGVNYSIDPKVKGTVNVRATGKLSESELLSIMESLLTINGATMIKGPDGVYRIVPMDKAAARGLPVYSRGAVPAGMRAQVVFLEQTPAKEMVTVLKPLLSTAGSIGEASNNSLIVVDTPDNMDKVLQLIHLVDTRALAHTMVRIIKVRNSSPKEVISELETIFGAYGTLSGKDKAKFGVSFLPVGRLNGVMVLATSRELMERALYWVRQLDAKTDMMANVHVYNVENYKAKNLANILTQVYGGTAAAATVKETKSEVGIQSGGAAFGGTGTSGGTGGLGGTQQQGGLGGTASGGMGLTGAGGTSGTGGTGGLGGAATGVPGGQTGGSPLKERATGAGAEGAALKEGVRVIPDEENNLLVVVAPPYEWNIISRILKELDIMPRQVLNEVLIAEVTLTDQLKYGIEFLIGGTASTTSNTATGTSTSPSGALVSTTSSTGESSTTTVAPATLSGVTNVSGAAATFTSTGGFTFLALDTVNKLKGLVNLLAAEGKVEILACPQIMAANNQEARIQIGSDVPTLTSTSTPLTSQTTSFSTSTVQYRSTGIILSVKPQINAKGLVTLDIGQEISDVDTSTTLATGSPSFTVRSAKTTLTTADNQTVVLGGLIREDKTRTNAGVPGLRRMPILGPLFGSEGISKTRTELLVLITPHIITNMQEGARVTQDLKEKVGLDETLPQQRRPAGMPGSSRPGY
jgi:general secretion pathway protein D